MGRRKSVLEALSIEYDISLYKKKPFYSFLKRFLDILNSLLALIILSPIFVFLRITLKPIICLILNERCSVGINLCAE